MSLNPCPGIGKSAEELAELQVQEQNNLALIPAQRRVLEAKAARAQRDPVPLKAYAQDLKDRMKAETRAADVTVSGSAGRLRVLE